MPETTDRDAETPSARRPGISRRQLVQTVAWSTPIILVATPAPAYAASADNIVVVDAIQATGSGTVIVELGGPVEDPWRIFVTVTNANAFESVLTTVVLTPSAGEFPDGDNTDEQLIPPGATVIFTGFGGLFMDNNKQETLTASVTGLPVEWTGTGLTVDIKAGNPIPYTAEA